MVNAPTPNALLPNLEERFMEPEGWRWHGFTRSSKNGERRLRFGSVSPKDSTPSATIICLPGLSEFAEKYYETARWAVANNYSFWVLDWFGQGGSGRYLTNPHKRHAVDFQDDVDDLHYFLSEYVKHASVSTDKGRIPFAMLAHSMGGNIGLHYLAQNPDVFACATFSAPMFGIKDFDPYPLYAARGLSTFLNAVAGRSYAFGAGDWTPDGGLDPAKLSSDPVRQILLREWFTANKDLQVGFVTFGWVHAALQSCARLYERGYLDQVETPSSIVRAGQDILVSGAAMDKVAALLPQAQLFDLPEARHEILMERDSLRNKFLKILSNTIQEHIIERPESLKPF